MRRVIVLLLAALVEPAAGLAAPPTIPYRGYLDRDGAPHTGHVEMRFRLHGASDTEPGPASFCDGGCAWEETQVVEVAAGGFETVLGGVVPLPAQGPDEQWLELAVRFEPGRGEWVYLAGRQRLEPGWYVQSAPAVEQLQLTDLHASTLRVEGRLSVAGRLSGRVGTLDANGQELVLDGVDHFTVARLNTVRVESQWSATRNGAGGQQVNVPNVEGPSVDTHVCFLTKIRAVQTAAPGPQIPQLSCELVAPAGGLWRLNLVNNSPRQADQVDCAARCVRIRP